MIPTQNVGLDPARYAAWLRDYGERSLRMRTALSELCFNTFEAQGREVERTRRQLREMRRTLPHRFCLVLYGSGADATALDRTKDSTAPLLDAAETEAVAAAARDPERNALRVSELMTLLDGLCGAQVALLDRDAPPDLPPGPIRFPTPDAIWFEVFTWVAELAWAIAIIGNTNANLLREMYHLDDTGLHRRTLVYAGPELLWWGDRCGDASHLRRWPLTVETFAQAFEFAAAQDAIPRAATK